MELDGFLVVWEPDEEEGQVSEEEFLAFREALAQLPDKQRFVVEMIVGANGREPHSLREVAEIMGVWENTVRWHYRKGLESLAQLAPRPDHG